jgi:hypothetical protein
MFEQNKYLEEYYKIIEHNKIVDKKSQYCEKHHIIPKSLGGDDKKYNIVYLTAKDHFKCHVLLTKFTIGIDNGKMWNAVWRMMNKQSHNQQRDYLFTEKEYEQARINHAKAQSERMSKTNNPFYGKTHTEETKQKMSALKKGKTYEEIFGKEYAVEMRDKRKNETTGKKRSLETKEKISQNKLGKKRDPELMKAIGLKNRGKLRDAETVEKMRLKREAGKQTCKHCSKTCILTNYKRWHGENCKHKNDLEITE